MRCKKAKATITMICDRGFRDQLRMNWLRGFYRDFNGDAVNTAAACSIDRDGNGCILRCGGGFECKGGVAAVQ